MKKSKIKKWGNLSVALAFFILAIVQKIFFMVLQESHLSCSPVMNNQMSWNE